MSDGQSVTTSRDPKAHKGENGQAVKATPEGGRSYIVRVWRRASVQTSARGLKRLPGMGTPFVALGLCCPGRVQGPFLSADVRDFGSIP